MDRDYTRTTEEEIFGYLSEIQNQEYTCQSFDLVMPQNSYSSYNLYGFSSNTCYISNTSYNGMTTDYITCFNEYTSDHSTYIIDLCQATGNTFNDVRRFDSTYMGEIYTVLFQNGITEVESFKTQIQKIIDCLSVPSVVDVDLHTGIFGNGWDYAVAVEEIGFKEIAMDSAAACKHRAELIFKMNEDGSVSYDMMTIMEVLSQPADEISDVEYYAVASAFVCMNESEMASVIKWCMVKQGDYVTTVDCQDMFSYLSRDFSGWTLDEVKYNNMCQALTDVSVANLLNLYAYDELYQMVKVEADEGDLSSYTGKSVQDLIESTADSLYENRKDVVQRQALFYSLGNIEEFCGYSESNYPDIVILHQECEDSSKYVLEFKERMGDAEREVPIYTSSVTIGEYKTATENMFDQIDYTGAVLSEQFAHGFTSEGFKDGYSGVEFVVEQVLGFSQDLGEDAIVDTGKEAIEIKFGKMAGIKAGVVYKALSSVVGAFDVYEEGKNNAYIIETQISNLEKSQVLDIFGCGIVDISYDTDKINGNEVYTTAGRYTVQSIEAFNGYYPDEAIYLMTFTEDIKRFAQEFDEQKYPGYILEEIQRAGGKY